MAEPKPQPLPTPEDVRDRPTPKPITDEQMWEYYRQNGRVK